MTEPRLGFWARCDQSVSLIYDYGVVYSSELMLERLMMQPPIRMESAEGGVQNLRGAERRSQDIGNTGD
jgi:hypothetical protein